MPLHVSVSVSRRLLSPTALARAAQARAPRGARWSNALRVACAFGLLVVASSCVNLKAVRDFAATSASATGFTPIVDGYVEQPQRLMRVTREDRRAPLEARYVERKNDRKRLVALQTALVDYMQVLGTLAGDTLVGAKKQGDELSKALEKSKFVDENEAKVAGALATLLARAVTEQWRQRELGRLIEQGGPHFDVLIDSLHTVVERGFVRELELERSELETYYRRLCTLAENEPNAGSTARQAFEAASAALEEWKLLRVHEVELRLEATHAYAKALAKIAAGHRELEAHAHDLGAKQLAAQLKTADDDVKDAFKRVKKLVEAE